MASPGGASLTHERAWWRQAGIDPIKVARRLWKETHPNEPTAFSPTGNASAV
jgi:hypothetical protein